MPSAHDIIYHTLTFSRDFLGAVTRDFTAQEWLTPPSHGGNPAAHTLGHLIAVERMAVSILKLPMPELAPGFAEQFARGQKPPADPKAYGDPLKLYPIFVTHRNAVIAAFASLPEMALAAPVDQPPGIPMKLFSNIGERLNFLGMHTHMHAGQLTMTRRSFGRPPMI